MSSALPLPGGSASRPLESSSAKPAHFTLMGEESSAAWPGMSDHAVAVAQHRVDHRHRERAHRHRHQLQDR